MLDLVGQLYDAALDPALWDGVAAQVAETFGATSTSLAVQRGQTVAFLDRTANFTERVLADYRAYYVGRDLWIQRGMSAGLGTVVASKDLIADEEFERSEFYTDVCRPANTFYMVGAVFPIDNQQLGVLGIHRPRRSGHYLEPDKARVARFLPHLARAVQLQTRFGRLTAERSAALDALERTGTATLVVTGEGRLLFANESAEALLRTGDALLVTHGQIGTNRRAATARLTELIRDAAATAAGRGQSSGGAVSIPREDRQPLTILVAPFRPARDGFGAPMPAALLLVRDPEALRPEALLLQHVFDLTPTEAQVAVRLAAGRSLRELAGELGMRVPTARTHLARILGKTNTNRQAELVAVLLRGIGALRLEL